uniref:14 kDa phosphohistidine phosphatase n=1 Tax=Chaetoceros debilis TaxID=122233 RepID=A0A7S3Q5L9_9STRA
MIILPLLLSSLYLFVLHPHHGSSAIAATHYNSNTSSSTSTSITTKHHHTTHKYNNNQSRSKVVSHIDTSIMAVGQEEENEDGQLVYTTSAADQAAVAALQKQLAKSNADAAAAGAAAGAGADADADAGAGADAGTSTSAEGGAPPDWTPVPSVQIAPGQHKYVLISATEPYPSGTNQRCYTQFFVTSKDGAHYHMNAAEPYVELLQERGYRDVNVTGGGRIYFNVEEKSINIFGFSYGFGLADHAISKEVVEKDERYKDYDVTWSNDGY